MVVTPENRMEVRKVELGLETADRVEVRSGLQRGRSGGDRQPRRAAAGPGRCSPKIDRRMSAAVEVR